MDFVQNWNLFRFENYLYFFISLDFRKMSRFFLDLKKQMKKENKKEWTAYQNTSTLIGPAHCTRPFRRRFRVAPLKAAYRSSRKICKLQPCAKQGLQHLRPNTYLISAQTAGAVNTRSHLAQKKHVLNPKNTRSHKKKQILGRWSLEKTQERYSMTWFPSVSSLWCADAA
jgi:predicted YcjX-like family ATPase